MQRVFIDMDGTVARFHDERDCLERMYERGFFLNLEPFRSVVAGVEQIKHYCKDVELWVLSAAVNDTCIREKDMWLDIHMPYISAEHRIYTGIGEDKSEQIPGGIAQSDILIDDYNNNLEQWRRAGGKSIKLVNNINDRAKVGERWCGDRLYHDASSEMFAQGLLKHVAIGFEDQVKLSIAGKLSRFETIHVCDTPEILLELGCEALPMLYTQRHLQIALGLSEEKTHGITIDTLLNMPELLQKPVMIYDSMRQDSLVMVLPALDDRGDPIIASVRSNGSGTYQGKEIKANFITSLHGRTSFFKGLEQMVQRDALLYWNKDLTLAFCRSAGVPMPNYLKSRPYNRIIHKSQNIGVPLFRRPQTYQR